MQLHEDGARKIQPVHRPRAHLPPVVRETHLEVPLDEATRLGSRSGCRDMPPSPADVFYGEWYSTPAQGSCSTTKAIGAGGCSWQRQPVARVVSGPRLLANGFWAAAHPWETTQTQRLLSNELLLRTAFAKIEGVLPRCCGC